MEPIEPPWQAIKEWIPDEEPDLDWFNCPRNPSNPDPDGFDQSPTWESEEIQLDEAAPWFSNTPEDPDRLAEKPPPKEILTKRFGRLRSR